MSTTSLSNLFTNIEPGFGSTGNRIKKIDMPNKLLYLIPADYVSSDAEKKLTVAGMFDEVRLKDGSLAILTFFVASQIQFEDSKGIGEKLVRVVLEDPEGKELATAKIPVSGNGSKKKKVNIVAKFPLVRFEKKGIHKINVLIDNEKCGKSGEIEVK